MSSSHYIGRGQVLFDMTADKAAAMQSPLARRGKPFPISDGRRAAFTAETGKFFAAWHGWRGPALLPRRSQVDLVSICRLMPQLVVLEVRSPAKTLFRLAGTEVERQFGAPLTGRNFITLAPPGQQRHRGGKLWQMAQQPCAAVMHLAVDRRSGQHHDLEIAAAPVLPDEAGAAPQLFAVVSCLPRQRWGEIDPITRNIARNLRFVDIGAGIPAGE